MRWGEGTPGPSPELTVVLGHRRTEVVAGLREVSNVCVCVGGGDFSPARLRRGGCGETPAVPTFSRDRMRLSSKEMQFWSPDGPQKGANTDPLQDGGVLRGRVAPWGP